jgi:uncharacterized protein YkwD
MVVSKLTVGPWLCLVVLPWVALGCAEDAPDEPADAPLGVGTASGSATQSATGSSSLEPVGPSAGGSANGDDGPSAGGAEGNPAPLGTAGSGADDGSGEPAADDGIGVVPDDAQAADDSALDDATDDSALDEPVGSDDEAAPSDDAPVADEAAPASDAGTAGSDPDDPVVTDPVAVDGGSDVPTGDHCAPVADWDPMWVAWEQEVLLLVNEARAVGHNCDAEGEFGPADPLTSNALLTCSARLHSLDMFERGFFDHYDPDGVDPGARIDATGYEWSTYGENIAQGYDSPAAVVETWLESDGHCSNIMNPNFTELGVGYYIGDTESRFGQDQHYWTQNFGAPRGEGGGGFGGFGD